MRRGACVAAGALALALYVRTLAPGVVAITDVPKFQFIGRVLGTAHNPGYPLYVVATHLFGYLPVGSLAYRINLFSAVCGAVAVALLALVILRTGVRAAVALAASLAFGLGVTFWQYATVAEVYTLHALLVAAMTLALFTWGERRNPRHFFLAIGCFALAVGHHPTTALLAPPFALYAIFKEPRFALRLRTIAGAFLLVLAGYTQYAFIIIRTRQGAWGESPAGNVRELLDVITGKQYAGGLTAPSGDLLWGRLLQIGSIWRTELTMAGVFLAVAGSVIWWRRDRAGLLFLATGMAAVAGFGIAYQVVDVNVFLIPVFMFSWVLAAAAADALWSRLPRSRVTAAMACLALAALPLAQYLRNFEHNDSSRRWREARYIDALVRELPARSALLMEDFLVDRMVLYEVLGEDALRGRDVLANVAPDYERVVSLHAAGYRVFAFGKTARALRRAGLDFAYAPLRVPYGPLARFLQDLRDGTTVAMGISAAVAPSVLASAPDLSTIGAEPPGPGVDRVSIAIVGTRGGRARSIHAARGNATLTANTNAGGVTVEASGQHAEIRLGGRELVRSARGPVLAVWDRKGTLDDVFAAAPDGHVTPDPGPLAVFELRAVRSWTALAKDPADITDHARTGHVMIRLSSNPCSIEIVAGAGRPLSPFVMDSAARRFDTVTVETIGPQNAPAPFRGSRHVFRVRIDSPQDVVHLALGGLPGVVFARTLKGRAELRSIDISTHLEQVDEDTRRLRMSRDHQEALVAGGWTPVQVDDTGSFRRVVSEEAEVLLPTPAGRAGGTLSLQLRPASPVARVTLLFNGIDLGARELAPGWKRYEWHVPAETLRSPVSSLVLRGTPGMELADVLVR